MLTDMSLLSLVIFFPMVGAILIAFIPDKQTDSIKGVSLVIAFITFLLSVFLWAGFDKVASGMQFTEKMTWVTSLGIRYHLGIDGISLLLIILTTILTVLCILASWNSVKHGVKGYFISMLV